MSDIQEIRTLLGGGLAREFEEINEVLRQHPASLGPTSAEANQAGAGEAAGAVEATDADSSPTSIPSEGDWFSRELVEMVRARARPSPEQIDSPTGQPSTANWNENRPNPYPQKPLDPRTALWQSARQLEGVAGMLEQIQAYENADAVRRQAACLWEKARSVKPLGR